MNRVGAEPASTAMGAFIKRGKVCFMQTKGARTIGCPERDRGALYVRWQAAVLSPPVSGAPVRLFTPLSLHSADAPDHVADIVGEQQRATLVERQASRSLQQADPGGTAPRSPCSRWLDDDSTSRARRPLSTAFARSRPTPCRPDCTGRRRMRGGQRCPSAMASCVASLRYLTS
jgi:hypothetical protein